MFHRKEKCTHENCEMRATLYVHTTCDKCGVIVENVKYSKIVDEMKRIFGGEKE